MSFYTIKPLARLLRQSTQEKFKLNEFSQLLARIKRQAARQQLNPAAYPHYQAILEGIIKRLALPNESITRTEINQIANDYIIKHKLYYISKIHKPAHDNIFGWLTDEEPKAYDMAFYHPASPDQHAAHHTIKLPTTYAPPGELLIELGQIIQKEKEKPAARLRQAEEFLKNVKPQLQKLKSQFYLRYEQGEKSLLVGNMQIDARNKSPAWQDHKAQGLLTRKSLIYKHMVQEIIHEGLKNGITRFIFQAGYANLISQWADNDRFEGREFVTAENIVRYQEQHTRLETLYKKITPGDIIAWKRSSCAVRDVIVIKKTPEKIQAVANESSHLIPIVYNLPFQKSFRAGLTPTTLKNDFNKTVNIEKNIRERVHTGCTAGFVSLGDRDFDGRIESSALRYVLHSSTLWSTRSEHDQIIHQLHKEFYRDLAPGLL